MRFLANRGPVIAVVLLVAMVSAAQADDGAPVTLEQALAAAPKAPAAQKAMRIASTANV